MIRKIFFTAFLYRGDFGVSYCCVCNHPAGALSSLHLADKHDIVRDKNGWVYYKTRVLKVTR